MGKFGILKLQVCMCQFNLYSSLGSLQTGPMPVSILRNTAINNRLQNQGLAAPTVALLRLIAFINYLCKNRRKCQFLQGWKQETKYFKEGHLFLLLPAASAKRPGH